MFIIQVTWKGEWVGGFDVRDTSCLKDTEMSCLRSANASSSSTEFSQILESRHWAFVFLCSDKKRCFQMIYLYWSPAASPFFSSFSCPVGEKKQNKIPPMNYLFCLMWPPYIISGCLFCFLDKLNMFVYYPQVQSPFESDIDSECL